jgi:hypothetical protein
MGIGHPMDYKMLAERFSEREKLHLKRHPGERPAVFYQLGLAYLGSVEELDSRSGTVIVRTTGRYAPPELIDELMGLDNSRYLLVIRSHKRFVSGHYRLSENYLEPVQPGKTPQLT